ncbi:hypothetical protein P5673_017461 [Acropora cervicornis]|uniref:Uncharacterized protein n=1 Tax=Acropora cervicornis TaxID=6130 RepID=A0AAD9V3H1_ACRCE|nr:hypothetical protein P5673_017461 [Acropora cervicornis]
MYGGPWRPNPSQHEGGSRNFYPNFRPQFVNARFPPQDHNFHPAQFGDLRHRQPYFSARSSFSGNPRQDFQPRGWQAQGPRQEFRPMGPQGQQRHWKRGGWRRGEGSSGIEAYYSHAMVEDPWKELEEKYKRKEEQSS